MTPVRRLIEEELPIERVNTASAREKSLRHGHISTMHLWWARRPLAMSRAVVYGTLLPDPGNEPERKQILRELAAASEFEASTRDAYLEPLRERLAVAYPAGAPKVLDCFAGGGAIPLEALRLGCDVTALDLNPVAHLIEKACLEYPQQYGQPTSESGNPLADDFLYWADWVRKEVQDDLGAVFPSGPTGARPAVYFWCRTMVCANPACRREIPLVTSRWLANSSRRKAWIEFHTTSTAIGITVHTAGHAGGDRSQGTIRASSATCPACGTSSTANQVRDYGKHSGFGAQLYAVLDIDGGERTYRVPTAAEVSGAFVEAAQRLAILEDLDDGTTSVPDEDMVKSQYRRYGNLPFGIGTFAGLFNTRQLYVLGRLAAGVRRAHMEMVEQGLPEGYARALATYLGFLVDKIADYNSSFTSWRTTAEASRSTFPRQAIAMVWDFVETDPLGSDGSGIWGAHTRWIELGLRHCATTSRRPANVLRGNAQGLPFADGEFDALIVDPPYYDAIQYGDLSDFFYVWLKRSIGHLYPDLFPTPLTPKKQEVIETRADKKSAEFVSHEEFEIRLQNALNEMARVTKPDGLVSIVFAHTDVEAWEHLLRALQAVGLVVSTSWPMRSERDARSTAQISAVLGSSVVLVCRKSAGQGEGYYDDVVRQLEARIASRLDRFETMGLVGADYFASAVGPAFEVFAQYQRVIRLSGDQVDVGALMTLARQVVARRAMGKLLGDESISALDDVSLLYLTWRWAYGPEPVPADEAYKLERALDVDLSALEGPHGLASRSGSNFSLRGPEERKGLRLGANALVIDVLHQACLLWDAGRRRDLEELLAESGMADEAAFWSLARALAEVLPEGDRERTMLLGLGGNQENLAAGAASHVKPEQGTLSLGDPS
jgi:adenine-specific DNA methylase